MRRPPRPPEQPLLGWRGLLTSLGHGACMFAVVVAVYAFGCLDCATGGPAGRPRLHLAGRRKPELDRPLPRGRLAPGQPAPAQCRILDRQPRRYLCTCPGDPVRPARRLVRLRSAALSMPGCWRCSCRRWSPSCWQRLGRAGVDLHQHPSVGAVHRDASISQLPRSRRVKHHGSGEGKNLHRHRRRRWHRPGLCVATGGGRGFVGLVRSHRWSKCPAARRRPPCHRSACALLACGRERAKRR